MPDIGLRLLVGCLVGPLVLLAALSEAQPSVLHGTARADHRPLSNVVVWLEGPNLPAAGPGKKVVLDQRDLTFAPHVLVVRTGTTVDFPNHDRVFHNVFSFRDGKVFDLGLYPVGTSKPLTFDHPGLSRIFCNIHPNMAAYIMVVDSPYFAVSDRSGAFAIDGVGRGAYTYHAWRAGRAELSGPWATGSPLTIEWP